jgi:hypothetical protein
VGWAILVSSLAFLLASFPARNSDLWIHLATGRSLLQGSGPPDTNTPLAPPLLASHTWLYDLLCYGLYAVLGGPGLVLVKALLVVGLALVLMHLSGGGRGWWLPAVCTALALLAMSTRLLLQPATLSYLLLALTFWLLRDRGIRRNNDPSLAGAAAWWRSLASASGLWSCWPLLILFVLWVNLDSGFLLGLATVALVELGLLLDALQKEETASTGFRFRLHPVSFLLLVGVCLLNPAHVHAFALPAFTSGAVTSPFEGAYLASLGMSPAALAYFPLLLLSFFSFVLNLPRWHWQRFLPWLGLALLSVFQARAVPFFAVVAGPMLAWNLQELLAHYHLGDRETRRQGDKETRRQGFKERQFAFNLLVSLSPCLLVFLLLAAWPGWLQTPPFEPRRWAVEPPPSLERSAAATRRWHEEGKLGPEARGLHLSAETAQAYAWFCPEEKGLVDDGLAAAVRGLPGAPDDGEARLRAAGINHVILYDSDRGRLLAALDRLLADPERWPLLYLEGDVAVFGWRDPRSANRDPFAGWQLNLNHLAFHAAEVRKAPPKQPEQDPEPRAWWEAFWKPAPRRPVDRDEATLHLLHAEALRHSAPQRHLLGWEGSQSAALAGAASGWASPAGLADAHLRLVLLQPLLPQPGSGADSLPPLDRLTLWWQEKYTLQRDDTPPALLYLAVRAARRALAANPQEAQAYLVLGESYRRLLHSTRERAWGEHLTELVQLRRAQASAALNQAVALKPDFAQAHLSLGELYLEMGFLDLALSHRGTYLKLAHDAGRPPEVSVADFREQEAQAQKALSQLAKVVADRENEYLIASAHKPLRERAALALQKGLAGKARDLLLESDITNFGAEGTLLELDLLLKTGRPKEVWRWTSPDHAAALGPGPYHWLRAQAQAASGNYAEAEEECVELARFQVLVPDGPEPRTIRGRMARLIGQAILDEQPSVRSVSSLFQQATTRFAFSTEIAALGRSLKREADVNVLRGLLLLEEGEIEEAEVAFRLALALWRDEGSAAVGSGLPFNGRRIAQGCLEWLSEDDKVTR